MAETDRRAKVNRAWTKQEVAPGRACFHQTPEHGDVKSLKRGRQEKGGIRKKRGGDKHSVTAASIVILTDNLPQKKPCLYSQMIKNRLKHSGHALRGNDSANVYNHSIWTWTLNAFPMDWLFFLIRKLWIQHNKWIRQQDKGIRSNSLTWKMCDSALRRCKWCLSLHAASSYTSSLRRTQHRCVHVPLQRARRSHPSTIYAAEQGQKLHYTSRNQIIRHCEAECFEWGTGSVERAFIEASVLF